MATWHPGFVHPWFILSLYFLLFSLLLQGLTQCLPKSNTNLNIYMRPLRRCLSSVFVKVPLLRQTSNQSLVWFVIHWPSSCVWIIYDESWGLVTRKSPDIVAVFCLLRADGASAMTWIYSPLPSTEVRYTSLVTVNVGQATRLLTLL